MAESIQQQIIPLTALFQAVQLVDDIATRGQCDTDAMTTSLASLFDFRVHPVDEIYGGQSTESGRISGLSPGYSTLKRCLEQQHPRLPVLLGYVVGLLQVEKYLRRDESLMSALRQRLEQLDRKNRDFELGQAHCINSLGQIYEDIMGQFSYRILVKGDRQYLQDNHNAAKIRALLLAGVRATFHWRLLGGRRWHLFLKRKALLSILNSI